MNFYGIVVVALILTTVLGSHSTHDDLVERIPEIFEEEIAPRKTDFTTELIQDVLNVAKSKTKSKTKSKPKAKAKGKSKGKAPKEIRWTPDTSTAPSSMKEWEKMWGSGADLTSEVKNLQSCRQRCIFNYKHVSKDALRKCKDGCKYYAELNIVPKGKKCKAGSKSCNNYIDKAENTCMVKCEKMTAPSGYSAKKTRAKDMARTVAGAHLPKRVPHKKLDAAAKSAVSIKEQAQMDLHFCKKGCGLAAANICYQGSGACLSVPGLLTKFPRVGSCRTTSNKCEGNASPTCHAEDCIQTPEQCHAACTDWRSKSGNHEMPICKDECPKL